MAATPDAAVRVTLMARKVYTWEVRASGRVQGVSYRFYAVQKARQLGVTGWVRNERDGAVCAVLQHSDQDVLSHMVRLLREGPPAARVDEFDTTHTSSDERFQSFEVRHLSPWRERKSGP
jgi:acylphosphatase